MRLKQATDEVTPAVPQTAAQERAVEPSGTSQSQEESTATDARTTSLAGARATPVHATVGVTASTTKPGERRSALPPARDALMVAVFGLLYQLLECTLFTFMKWTGPGAIPWVMIIAVAVFILIICLPTLLAFYLGWRRRSGLQGGVLGLILGLTLPLGMLAYMVVSPMRHGIPADIFHNTTTNLLIASVLLSGVLGGVCG